jgi:peptide/nickel transport system permease protein
MAAELLTAPQERTRRGIARQAVRRWQLTVSLLGILLLVVLAVFAPLIAPYNPLTQFTSAKALQAPSLAHLMGTDEVGRDVFSRVVYGTQLSLLISFLILSFGMIIGVAVGATAALGGGIVDEVLMRVTDVFFAVPLLILGMAFVATLGPSVKSLVIAMSLAWWPSYARLIRGQLLSIKERTFVESARVIGNSSIRVTLRHILPQTFPELLVRATLDVGNVILIVSGLSFLGLGAQPPTAEWGAMIGDGRTFALSAPWLMLFPGLAIVFTILMFSMLGDGLRDLLHDGGFR